MKFEIVKNELAGALTALGKLVTRTSPVEANKSIRIKGENGKLVFETTNGTEHLFFTMDGAFTGAFTFIADFEALRVAVKGSRNKDLIFETDKNFLLVDGKLLTPIKCDFPDTPTVKEKSHSELLPSSFMELLATAVPIINRNEYRKVLQGVQLSRDGITVTNGRELLNIPLPLNMDELILPFPLPLLAAKSEAQGHLITWKEKEETFFEIVTGAWRWYGKGIQGKYPDWKTIIPDRKYLPNTVTFSEQQGKEMIAFLKTIPDEKPHTTIDLEMKDKCTLILKHKEQKREFPAEFAVEKNVFAMAVSKEILMHLLSQGHTKLECASTCHSPFIASCGLGQFIAMPLHHPTPKQTENTIQTTQPTEKETIIMSNEPKTITNPVTVAATETMQEINPLEELSASIEALRSKLKVMFEESNALSRKVKEVALTQKQKERDFILAKRAIERIRMAI